MVFDKQAAYIVKVHSSVTDYYVELLEYVDETTILITI